MLKKILNKRGSEVVQTLIVIAIMGGLAVAAITGLSTKITQKNTEVIDAIDVQVDDALGSQTTTTP